MNNLIAVVDKMPDLCEIRQEDDDETSREVVFIVNRRNSYPLHEGLRLMLELLENKGVKVRVRTGGVDLTMDQFEKYGVFAPGAKVSKTALNRQGVYNLRSQLNKLIEEGLKMPEDSPQYALTARRVAHLRSMLATIEPDLPVSDELMEKSAVALKRLEQLMKEATLNATSKPDVAGEVHIDEGTSSQITGTVVVPSKLESD